MKYFALSLALAGALSAAEFRTGQAARAVIGQETFTRMRQGATSSLLGAVGGVAYANNTLVVVDSSRIPAFPQNQRVLIYRDIAEQIPAPKASFHNWELRCPMCQAAASTVLGQPDFNKTDIGLTQSRFRTPTHVATDGTRLVVADTDNNRVLIWNSLPQANDQPADIVLGQTNFTSGGINNGGSGNSPSAQGLRGPQGVWIQGNRLFVADTQNNRVLIWNSFPTQNAQAADVVLGAPNFTTFVQPDLVQLPVSASATSLLNPVSVTSDGIRLFVTDLGHNRVVVWNSIPTQNAQPGDFVLGQPDIASTTEQNASDPNNSRFLCPSNGTNAEGQPTYPYACAATLSFPRFAISDGTRLFIADGGNDRVLVYHTMPTRSGQRADAILGQPTEDVASDSDGFRVSAADTVRTPSALAWDGTNLYVADPFNRRVMVFSMGDEELPLQSVTNAASRQVFAAGSLTFSADPKENDEVTLRIADARDYKYKAVANDKIANVVTGLVQAVNAGAGDPDVIATGNPLFGQVLLTARRSGADGNNVQTSVTFSTGAQLTGAVAGTTLTGGRDTAKIAPGTLVTVVGERLADTTASAAAGANLPHTLGGVEVYVDGLSVPLLYVSPTQINAQLPYEVNESTSVTLWVRNQNGSSVRITNPVAVPLVPANPGIFALEGTDPRPAIAYHSTSNASGVIHIDGTPKAGDVVSIKIGDDAEEGGSQTYSYTVVENDTREMVRDALIAAINGAEDARVTAEPGGLYARVVLRSKIAGPDGEGLKYGATGTESTTLSPYGERLTGANTAGAPVTPENPARPGELITVYANGLGLVQPEEAKLNTVTGVLFEGPAYNYTNRPVDDAIVGGRTAPPIFARLKPGAIGIYEVTVLLNADIPTNEQTEMIIAQDIYVSNIVTLPVFNPNPPAQ